jgi:cytochrome P450
MVVRVVIVVASCRPPPWGRTPALYATAREPVRPIWQARQVIDVDLLSPASFAEGQPHDQFAWLRANDPVHWHPEPGADGFWALTRYRDVKTVGRDPTTFSSTPTVMIGDEGGFDLDDHQMMLMADPPRHTALRKSVAAEFLPRAARAMRPRIEELATRIVDGVVGHSGCDLVTDVAGLMPSYVIADMLGLPLEDGVELYALTEAIHAAPESQAAGAGMAAVVEMFNYARGVWEARRAEPSDDLASLIAHAVVDGRELDVVDFNLFFLLLIDAGGDTTRNLVAGGLDALFAHPSQLAWLVDDPDARMAPAVEELLRWVSPVVYMRRTAQRATEIDGRHVLRLGQPRPRGVRADGRPARPGPHAQRPRRLRRRRTALLPGRPHRPGRDPRAAPRAADAARRPAPRRSDRMAPVDVHLGPQAPPDHLSEGPGGRLTTAGASTSVSSGRPARADRHRPHDRHAHGRGRGTRGRRAARPPAGSLAPPVGRRRGETGVRR